MKEESDRAGEARESDSDFIFLGPKLRLGPQLRAALLLLENKSNPPASENNRDAFLLCVHNAETARKTEKREAREEQDKLNPRRSA